MTPAQLKAWRLAHGLTQDKAAILLGVARITFQKWEWGRNPIPKTAVTLIKLIKLCDRSTLEVGMVKPTGGGEMAHSSDKGAMAKHAKLLNAQRKGEAWQPSKKSKSKKPPKNEAGRSR